MLSLLQTTNVNISWPQVNVLNFDMWEVNEIDNMVSQPCSFLNGITLCGKNFT